MASLQNQSLVKRLAKHFSGKIKKLRCFDANVCKSAVPSTRTWEAKYMPGELFECEAIFEHVGHKFSASANREFVCLRMKLEGVSCSPIFSANRQDRVIMLKTVVKPSVNFSIPVYASDKASAETVWRWLRDDDRGPF